MILQTVSMIFMKMKYYKILDSRGRLTVPIELREQVDIQTGDVLELSINKNSIMIEKIDIVKLNEETSGNMKNMIMSTAKKLDRGSLLFLAKRLVELAEKEEMND